jgi:hypothetical protein
MGVSTEPSLLTSDQVLRVANEDGTRAYGDLSGYRIELWLADDGWHVEYHVDPAHGQGGGPYYLIDPADGTIKWKKYYQ